MSLKKTLAALVVASVLAAAVVAQERTGQWLPVDFVALDQHGQPVAELSIDEIDLRINGKRRVVRAVRRIAAAPQTAPAVRGLPAPFGTSADSASGRTFLFVLDEDSFRAGREQPFRNALSGLLDKLTSVDMVSVVGLPYGGVRVPLTNDHVKVRHVIERASGQRANAETGSQMACRTRLVLESLENLLRSMAGRTSPTTVVLLTAGLASPRRDAPMALAPGMCELQADLFKRVGAAAGVARANFFIAQPDDIVGIGGFGSETISGTGFNGSDNPLGGIEDLAGVTRAVRLPLTALGSEALTRVDAESGTYFVAEIESQLSDFDPRSQRLDITVSRPGVTLRVRPDIAFVRPRATAASGTRVTVTDMLMSLGTFADLPLRASAYALGSAPASGGDGMIQVALLSEPVARDTRLASAGAVLVDDEGTVAARWSATDADEVPLMGIVTVPPGRYRLRVAAVDEQGRGGAADFRFDAALTTAGPVTLGGLVLGLSRDGNLMPRLVFGNEPAALASFDIEGADARVTAVLEVAASLDGPPLVRVPLAIRAAGPNRFTALGTVPLGALTAGDYIVRGVVQVQDGPSASTVRTLRKQ
jgi:hypothetical protein